jgi:glycosyltransferase involved in cell wall biosynthesis
MKQYSIAVLLPHLEVFGGIRRYLALGGLWSAWGHAVTLRTATGQPPDWTPFAGRVERHDAASPGVPFDAAFTPQPALLPRLRELPAARRVYYCVLEGEPGEGAALRDPGLTLMANSGALVARLARAARRPVLDGVGGIDPAFFHPDRSARAPGKLSILAYGRRSRPKKGTDLIVRAVESIAPRFPTLELVLFDHVGPGNETDPRTGFAAKIPVRFELNRTQEELARLYAAADVFVAAEKKAGWCNTAIEAMSAGCALVCTPSGTRDFARHDETAWVVPVRHPWFLARGLARVLGDNALRTRLEAAGPAAVRPFAWEVLAAKIFDQLGMSDGVPEHVRKRPQTPSELVAPDSV